ncbi:MAG: repressor LexA [Deltaproteobacteria bacterium]|nr:repressor LexA [Deltaproteobacteria bacterium]MBN2673030.1 repressor LexA [Deltaproteobacteria bacterium]
MAPKTPKGQTRRQVFRFMRDHITAGLPPTVREVQEAFAFKSVQTAREHLENLVREGKLVKQSGISRGYSLPDIIELVPQLPVPLLGSVQAGQLTEAIEDPDGYIGVQQSRGVGEELFALKVRGYSMMNAGILPGDVVIVRKQETADNGDIVVAMVEEEATVKRFKMIKGRPELHPENDEFEPIVPTGDLRLLGKVIEVRRYLDSMVVS